MNVAELPVPARLEFTIPGDVVPAQMGRLLSNGRTQRDTRAKAYQLHAKYHALMRVRIARWEATREESFAVTLRVFVGTLRTIDVDNCSKNLLDALKGVVFPDDRQVIDLHVFKRLDRGDPRVVVTVERARP